MIDVLVTVSYILAAVFFVLGVIVLIKWYRLAQKLDRELDTAEKDGCAAAEIEGGRHG